MKTVCCKPILISMIGLLSLLPMLLPSEAHCQSAPEPAIVVSIAPISEQIADTSYLIEEAGYGSMKFFIKTQMKHFTSGIDKEKACGVLLYFEEDDPTPKSVGFAPVSNLDDFLDTIAQFAEVDDADEIISITPSNGENMLMKQVGNYIFIAEEEEGFDNLPADPEGMLGDLPASYNVAARIFGQRVPESLRMQMIDGIKDGYMSTMDQLAEDDPDLADEQRDAFEEQMAKMEDLVYDMDEVLVGFRADKEAGAMVMDFQMTALEGTELAKSFEAMSDAEPSRFAGFLRDDAAMSSNACFSVLPAEAKQYANGMTQAIDKMVSELDADGDLSESEVETIESASEKIVEALTETFESGRVDSAGVVLMGDQTVNMAAVMEIADPRKVEDAVKELVELGEAKMGEDLQVSLNSGSHNGVTFHELVIKVPEDEEEVLDYFGSEITVIVGIGDKEVYMGAGTDPMPTLKEAMDSKSSGEKLFPVVYNINLTPILKYASSVNDMPMIEDMLGTLEESGNDRLRMFLDGIENGVLTRFEIQDGVLGLIQSAVVAAQSGGFNQDDF